MSMQIRQKPFHVTGITLKSSALIVAVAALLAAGVAWGVDLRVNGGIGNGGITCTLTDLSVDPETGDVDVTVSDLDDADCAGGNSGGTVPPQPSLSVSATAITQGDTLTVNWNATDATSCTAGGTFPGWSGTKGTNGTEFLSTNTSTPTGDLTVELTCSNSAGSSPTAIRTVTVSTSGGGGTACTGTRAPPPGMTRAIQCNLFDSSVDCRSYADVFGGIPGTTGIRQLAVDENEYLAMRLDPASVPPDAQANISLEALQGTFDFITFGQPLWSISTCPGDFNESAIVNELNDPDCVLDGFTAKFGFKYGGASAVNDSGRCALSLEPGTVYYLNLVWTSDPAGTPNDQITWRCGTGDDQCGAQFKPGSFSGW